MVLSRCFESWNDKRPTNMPFMERGERESSLMLSVGCGVFAAVCFEALCSARVE